MRNILVGLVVMLLTACSSVNTNWDYNPDVNFTQFKTYAWVQTQSGSEYHLDGLMDERVRNAVNDQLQAKGLTLVAADKADVLVNYLTKVDKELNVDTFTTNYGYSPFYDPNFIGPYWGPSANVSTQTVVREYNVGTLIIDIVDRKTDKLVWRGSLADTLKKQYTPQERITAVNEAVANILTNFPPKADK